MTHATPSVATAIEYHNYLPYRVRAALNARGIPDDTLARFLIGWNGQRITIPIFNREGDLAFFKLARDPDERRASPKMLATPGSAAALYGWENVKPHVRRVIVCEGEFDRLVLEARGIRAVTSTAGAGVFKREWAEALSAIEDVYVCFDRDEAGREGALRVARMIRDARIIDLPQAVGEDGDVTDFFVGLRATAQNFERLIENAVPPPPARKPAAPSFEPRSPDPEIRDLKAAVPIERVVSRYLPLWPRGTALAGRCPFHDDRTPSFVVFRASRRFRCFGCGAQGDAIDFLRRIDNLSFRDAVDALRRLA